MKNYLTELREKHANGWGGYHNDAPNMCSIRNGVSYHYCPVQKDNITDDVKSVVITYNLSECTKSDIDEAKTLIYSMIETISDKYAKTAQITQKPTIHDIKATYAGNNTTRFNIYATTPMLKNGNYLIDDILNRYYGNIPEMSSTNTIRYNIKEE